MCEETALVVEALYISTVEPLQNLHLEVANLFNNCHIQYVSSEDVYTHPAGPSAKQERESLLSIFVLRVCKGTLAHIEEKYALLVSHVNFAEREKTSQRNGLSVYRSWIMKDAGENRMLCGGHGHSAYRII